MSTTPAAADGTAAIKRTSPARAIMVASIGNALEWYDLIIFGFLTVIISKQFFPTTDPDTALLLTLATFGISFFMRPLGGIVIGIYADRAGRMKALVLAATLMMIGTAMVAFMPTYDDIGVAATIGILIARLIAGFSAGGEFASATAFLAEQSQERRGFFASWQVASQGITLILASLTGVMLSTLLTPGQLEDWGWRLPFIFGMLIGPVALYMRLKVPETPEFQESGPAEAPLRETLGQHKFRLLLAVGVTALGTVASYLVLYLPTFATKELGVPAASAFWATLATGVIQFLLSPLIGTLGDRIGRTRVMLTAAVATLLLIFPLYSWLVAAPSPSTLLVVAVVIGFLLTGYFASQPAFMSDLFPVRARTTGMSLAYNFAVMIFGGFAPLILATLVTATGSKVSPSFYVMFAASLSIAALLASRSAIGAAGSERAGRAGGATVLA